MIHVEKLSMAYGGQILLDEACFDLCSGEKCGFVGRNGSGKTTLFRLITGKETSDGGLITMPRGYTLGYLDQHIRFSKPTILEEAILGLREDERDLVYKVEKLLFGLGFKQDDLDLPPEMLSGGYQLRLHLAKVLAGEPQCLLLDEPTNYLDIVSIRWFAKFLQQFKGEFLLITHDREFMDSVCTHTAGIHANKIRKVEGTTVQFFEQIFQQEEIHERTRQNLQKKQEHLQSYIDRFGAKASKASQAQSKRKMLERIPVLEKLKELYHLDFTFNELPFMGKRMFDMNDVTFAYAPDAPHIINSFSLTIEPGDRIAVIGKNGRGKSTLLKLLMQEITPQTGSVRRFDNVKPGYFGQTNIDRLHKDMTVEEELSAANPKYNISQIKALAGLMMFSGDLAKKPMRVLSGGEKSRVLLGKILATPCNALFLDEPTHHLDMESIEALIDALEDFNGAIVIVTHSELILERIQTNKIVICHQGKQELFQGTYPEFLEQVGWPEDTKNPVQEKKKAVDFHAEKKARAEAVIARSKAIQPLERAFKQCEEKIMKLEEEQKKEQQAILNAVQQNNPNIQDLVKSTGERQKIIDAFFADLERLHTELQEKQAEFE